MFSNQGNYNVCPCCHQLIQSGMPNQQPQFQQFQPQQPQFQPYQPQQPQFQPFQPQQPQFQPYEDYRQNYRENYCGMPPKRENYDWKLPNLPIDNLPRIPNLPSMPEFQPRSNKKGCIVFVFAEWCGHCRNYRPTWEKIKSSNSGDFDFVEAEEGKLPDDSQLPADLKKGNKSRESIDKALGNGRGFPTLFFVVNGDTKEIMNRNALMDEVKKFL